MSCRYACVCGMNCLRCNTKAPERYFGEAEDIHDEVYGSSQQQRDNDKAYDEYMSELEEQQIEEHCQGECYEAYQEDYEEYRKCKRIDILPPDGLIREMKDIWNVYKNHRI